MRQQLLCRVPLFSTNDFIHKKKKHGTPMPLPAKHPHLASTHNWAVWPHNVQGRSKKEKKRRKKTRAELHTYKIPA